MISICKSCGVEWHADNPMDYCEECQKIPYEEPEIDYGDIDPPLKGNKTGHIRPKDFVLEPKMAHDLRIEDIAKAITNDPDIFNET